MPSELVDRFDVGRLDSAKISRTSQGFMRVQGRLTRTGVLDYHRADGTLYRELRTPEEVFRSDSLATLAYAPVTEDHPGMVTPVNVRQHKVGMVTEDVRQDGNFVAGSAIIESAGTIAKVSAKKLCELSPGYQCQVEHKPGTYRSQHYDGIQRDIVYNHLALGPRDWGRSGNEVSLRLDGRSEGAAIASVERCDLGRYLVERLTSLGLGDGDARSALHLDAFEYSLLLNGFSAPSSELVQRIADLAEVDASKFAQFTGCTVAKQDGPAPIPEIQAMKMTKKTIRLDGVNYEIEIPEALASNFDAAIAKLVQDGAKAEGLQGKLDASEKATKDIQEKLDAATSPAAVSAAASERVALIESCKRIAPKVEFKNDATNHELMSVALEAAGHKFDSKASEGYLEGLFAGALKAAPEAKADGRRSIGVAPPGLRQDGEQPVDSRTAQERMSQRHRDAWKPKTASA